MGEKESMVSAIITTYKREPSMVLRALDSIITQTYRDIEIIVVDDSPSDFASRKDVQAAVIKRQEENPEINIRYIAHANNMGACVARNTGLEAAKGEYIAYLDDDDEWLPEKIDKQIKAIQKSDAALVYCDCLYIDDSKGTTIQRDKEYIKGKALTRLLYSNFIESTSYPLIRKKCLQEIGGFDPLMQAAQDYDVWLRLAERYEIDYVDEPLVLYHEHEGERITTNYARKISGLERINKKYSRYINTDRKLWWKRNSVLVKYYALNGEKIKAVLIWIKCVSKYPENVKDNTMIFLELLKTCLLYKRIHTTA